MLNKADLSLKIPYFFNTKLMEFYSKSQKQFIKIKLLKYFNKILIIY